LELASPRSAVHRKVIQGMIEVKLDAAFAATAADVI
jgi:hypothetical protein